TTSPSCCDGSGNFCVCSPHSSSRSRADHCRSKRLESEFFTIDQIMRQKIHNEFIGRRITRLPLRSEAAIHHIGKIDGRTLRRSRYG
ncbi:hypothetical protein, partial [Rhizobium grahamii]|uniref:hypothetical protein n=1 Tax=Rhizobium grahamii TaxID=1120045 RepID=UPI001AECB7ED